MICLYFKIPEKFVRLILQDEFLVLHVLLVHMDQFIFLAEFPLDHLSHPAVSSLVLVLCLFAVFTLYVINGLVSIIM